MDMEIYQIVYKKKKNTVLVKIFVMLIKLIIINARRFFYILQ